MGFWFLRKSAFYRRPPAGGIRDLEHFDVDIDAGGQVEVGQAFDNLRRWAQDIHQTFVDSHLELFSGIFINKA